MPDITYHNVKRIWVQPVSNTGTHWFGVQIELEGGTFEEVTLFGASPNVCDLADCSEMIPYEILCNVGAHAKREYLD